MAITLQTLVNQAADYIKAELVTAGTPPVYDTDSQAIVDRLIGGINEAKNIIVKRRYHISKIETIMLDGNSCFDPDNLSEEYFKLVSVKYDDFEIPTHYEGGLISCGVCPSIPVDVEYWYIPADLAELDDDYPFPDAIDYKALCYRAAQRYYDIRGGQNDQRKSQIWEKLWYEALKDMSNINAASKRVRCVYEGK